MPINQSLRIEIHSSEQDPQNYSSQTSFSSITVQQPQELSVLLPFLSQGGEKSYPSGSLLLFSLFSFSYGGLPSCGVVHYMF